jgi:Ca2+/Na+ antiporter
MVSLVQNYLLIGLIVIGIFCLILAMIWRLIRDFFHENYSYFDFIFIIAYFVEQLTLIILLVLEPGRMVFWVSAFALLVVTTASIQKLSMDSKDKKIRELNTILRQNSIRKSRAIKKLMKENREITDYVEELER